MHGIGPGTPNCINATLHIHTKKINTKQSHTSFNFFNNNSQRRPWCSNKHHITIIKQKHFNLNILNNNSRRWPWCSSPSSRRWPRRPPCACSRPGPCRCISAWWAGRWWTRTWTTPCPTRLFVWFDRVWHEFTLLGCCKIN